MNEPTNTLMAKPRKVQRAAWIALLALALGTAAAGVLWLLQERIERLPLQRSGPPALVQWGATRPALWLLTRQEERHQQRKRTVTRYRFELHGHDVETAERSWSRLRPRWTTELPITELHNRWELAERLLLVGSAPSADDDRPLSRELLLSLKLDDGSLRQWDIQRGSAQR